MPPPNWRGWPGGKKFALVLTHDVECLHGYNRVYDLVRLETACGFHSCYNFVAEDYEVSANLRSDLSKKGFEIGVHGDRHDGKLFFSRRIFLKRARRINHYLDEWGAVGFRAPATHHNLEWMHFLNIEYDASTFDTDPFEPQPDGMHTIFPFWVANSKNGTGYVELPYTLAQDSTLFILMKEKNIDIWKRKLDWIVEHGGMAMLITHPDYMIFNDDNKKPFMYSLDFYENILKYIKEKYTDMYWHVLPREMAAFWRENYAVTG
jgi:hypothetical protein